MALVVGGTVNAPPFAPVPLSPANAAALPLTGTVTFKWLFQPGSPDNTQGAWAFRRKVSGSNAWQWWNVSTTAWQSTVVFNTGATSTYTFPAGAWTNGTVWNWSVSSVDTHGTRGGYCLTQTLTGLLRASVTVSAPTGTIATARPTVKWTATVAPGAAQISYRVAVFTAAQYGAAGFTPATSQGVYDSGVVNGNARSLTLPAAVELPNSVTYRAYVQVTETGGLASAWAYKGFTTGYTAPATPTITATTGTTETTGKPVTTVVVTGQDTGALVGSTFLTLRYSDDTGASWWPVRGGTTVAVPADDQVVTVVDRTSPFGYERTYQALIQTKGATPVVSTAATATVTAPTPPQWWLSDPLTGVAVALRLKPGTLKSISTDRQQLYAIIGRPDPVILSDSFQLPNLTLTLIFIDTASYQTFEAMRATQHVFLLQGPHPAGQWYVRLGPTKQDTTTLPSLRGWQSGTGVVRMVQVTAQAVAAP